MVDGQGSMADNGFVCPVEEGDERRCPPEFQSMKPSLTEPLLRGQGTASSAVRDPHSPPPAHCVPAGAAKAARIQYRCGESLRIARDPLPMSVEGAPWSASAGPAPEEHA